MTTQIRAMAQLLGRHLIRRAPKSGNQTAFSPIVRASLILIYAQTGYHAGRAWRVVGGDRNLAAPWLLLSVAGIAVGTGIRLFCPGARGQRSPLQAGLLDALPISAAFRIAGGIAQAWTAHAFGMAALLAASGGVSAEVVVSSMFVSTGGVMLGCGAMLLGRSFWRYGPSAKAARWMSLVEAPFLLLAVFMAAMPELRYGPASGGMPLTIAASRLAARPTTIALGTAMLCIGMALAACAERRGYDRVEPLPQVRPARVRYVATMRAAERLLDARQSGRVLLGLQAALSYGFVVLIGTAIVRNELDETLNASTLIVTGHAWVLGAAAWSAISHARRSVERDLRAGSLLGALPLTTRAMLSVKVGVVRRPTILIAAAYPLLLAVVPAAQRWEVVWRTAEMMLALWLFVDAAVSVAFISASRSDDVGARFVSTRRWLNTLVIAMPLGATLGAANPVQGAVWVACLAITADLAGRAAATFEYGSGEARATPDYWQALNALAMFMLIQLGFIAYLRWLAISSVWPMNVAYLTSACWLARRTPKSAVAFTVPDAGTAWRLLTLGVGGGAVATAFGLGYLRLLDALSVARQVLATRTPVDAALVSIVLLVAAPLVEECSYRGWLQSSLASQWERRRWVGPLITAVVFAAVHPPLTWIPVFVLGCVTGALFSVTHTVAPGVLAHAIYNCGMLAVSINS